MEISLSKFACAFLSSFRVDTALIATSSPVVRLLALYTCGRAVCTQTAVKRKLKLDRLRWRENERISGKQPDQRRTVAKDPLPSTPVTV